jgi:hypothetical protein
MIREYIFNFQDLSVERSRVEELMGFSPGEVPEPFNTLITKAFDDIPELCDVRAGYQLLSSPVFEKEEFEIRANATVFRPGKIVFNLLKKSTSLMVFVATAGQKTCDRISFLAEAGDPVESYIYDLLGSVIADKAAEKLITLLEGEVEKSGLSLTDPFSPGSCDWNIADQKPLFALFPEGFCGVSLSPSLLMLPVKSVSGMAGVGKGMKRRGEQCFICNDASCMFGKINRSKSLHL